MKIVLRVIGTIVLLALVAVISIYAWVSPSAECLDGICMAPSSRSRLKTGAPFRLRKAGSVRSKWIRTHRRPSTSPAPRWARTSMSAT